MAALFKKFLFQAGCGQVTPYVEIRNGASNLAPLYGFLDGCGQNLPANPIISRSNELQLTLLESNAGAGESINVTYEGNVIFMAGPPQDVRQPRPGPCLNFEN